MSVEIKHAITISEMARMVGLSRSRFHQLIGSAFPYPLYCVATRRPFYDEELQKTCLDVRRRNCGIDGKPILFYARRLDLPAVRPHNKVLRPVKKPSKHAHMIEGLKGLGLSGITEGQVEAAMGHLYPNGSDGTDEPTRLRTLFVHLMRQDRHDNVSP